MTANSQLLTTTPKTKKQTKPTTRTGTEPQKGRSHGGLSAGEWEGERGGKVQRISSINDRYKIDRGRLRIYRKWRSKKTCMYAPWT